MQMDTQPAFSEPAHRVFAAAQAEAARLGHEYIGTEHLLLGLVQDPDGRACVVLKRLGVDPRTIPDRVETVIQRGNDTSQAPYRPYAARARRAIEQAVVKATELGHSSVRSEHLLLGLLGEARGPAALVLNQLGVTADAALSETLRLPETHPR